MLSVRACLLLSLMLVLPSLSHAAQRVLVSVHPLALLVKSAWPQLEVSSLVPSNQSPHDFSLKPSDIRRVNEAAMVV
ncbi:MAG: zinc ABC transporter substrate-binding protein, partial [Bermanella sp.]